MDIKLEFFYELSENYMLKLIHILFKHVFDMISGHACPYKGNPGQNMNSDEYNGSRPFFKRLSVY